MTGCTTRVHLFFFVLFYSQLISLLSGECTLQLVVMSDIEIDEILCYISNRIDSVPNDQLVAICVNSFEASEIKDSKLRLFNKCERGPENDDPPPGCTKYQARRGVNSANNNVQDIIALMQELGTNCPSYAAVNLNKLPPITLDIIDVKALLSSLSINAIPYVLSAMSNF